MQWETPAPEGAPNLGQAQNWGGVKHVLWDLNPFPIPLSNAEEQTHNYTHSKTQFLRSPNPMLE